MRMTHYGLVLSETVLARSLVAELHDVLPGDLEGCVHAQLRAGDAVRRGDEAEEPYVAGSSVRVTVTP